MRSQRVAVLRHQPLPVGGEPRDRGFLDVVGRHLHELGLRRRAGGGTARQQQVGQFVIRLEAAGLPRRRLRATRRPSWASGHSEAMNWVKAASAAAGPAMRDACAKSNRLTVMRIECGRPGSRVGQIEPALDASIRTSMRSSRVDRLAY